MLGSLLLSAALAVGQSGPRAPDGFDWALVPPPPPPGKALAAPSRPVPPPPPRADEPPTVLVQAVALPPAAAEPTLQLVQAQDKPAPVPFEELNPIQIDAPLLPPSPAPGEVAASSEEAGAADRWLLMRSLQGTWMGSALDENRMTVFGWVEGSYTASTTDISNSPVVWNDRADQFLLNQTWMRFQRSVQTTGTTEPSWGFLTDWMYGSDFRFTLPRGLWNSQFLSGDGGTNLYGWDPIQHYVNVYVPTLFSGTEFRVGRLWTPWGVESLEGISTPFVSRSYAFNWCPPFTHCGFGAYVTFNPQWSGVFLATNGNDVYWGDPAAEWRSVGNVKWTQPGGGRNTVTGAWSLGRGKFNEAESFNNINAVDVVYTHVINPRLNYNLEAIYGWQTNMPTVPSGTADWGSVAQYLFYTFSPRVIGIARYELFDDFDGVRTGFEGLYSAVTGGFQYRPVKSVIIRPELRWDYNVESTPFEGKHGIFTATADVIFRW